MKKTLFTLMLLLCCMTAAWAQDDGFINVDTTEKLWNAIKANDHAKVRLTADFALSDINKDGETYCNTFYGTIDGNGHTIKGDPKADVRARTYMFTYSEGATFKNLTFKGIRVNSQEHSNQAIITSQAKNGCVFENITFDNVHSFSNYNNVGAAAGYAYDCTFTNIKVKNSDFTVDDNYVGSVVGDADKCTFTNIEVTNCKTYAHDDCAGGIVGHSRNCKFANVDVKNSFFQVDGYNVGGVAGKSIEGSQFTNCVVDDQSCVCSDGTYLVGALAGGITGFSDNCKFYDCINSALIASNDELVGGIIGQAINNTFVDGCLNTGMLVYMKTEEVNNSYYNKYKTMSGMTGVTKTYNGKEYLIRKVDDRKGDVSAYGGIVGYMINCTISRCANLGTLTTEHSCGGIVGISQSETIRDCLSDFHGTNNGVIGIAGYVWYDKTTIANSLNISPFGYYCCNDGTCYADNVVDHPKEDEQKLGVACAKLGVNWQQNIGIDPYPTPTGNKGVYHTRKVTNQYGTVCLPFALKSDDKINYYTLSRKEDDEQGIKLVFTYLDEVMPGYPVLFRAAEAKDADADNPVEICFNNAGKEITTTPINKTLDAGFWDVWGIFEQRVFEGDLAQNIYYVSGGEIRNAKKVTIAPYRAWFYCPSIDDLKNSVTGQAKSIRFVIEDEDGSTTALESIVNDLVPVQKNSKTYSIMGTEVNNNYRGIVISNGKKILRK